ncbi:MAG: hypothetical protein AB7P94_12945 [Steroidobacteraceae bacterium]
MPDSRSAFLANIARLGKQANELQRRAVQMNAAAVERIVRTRSRDAQEIEHALDRLLDCACVPEGLELFKTLCRYYYTLDPNAAAGYVNCYREMWEQDDVRRLEPE